MFSFKNKSSTFRISPVLNFFSVPQQSLLDQFSVRNALEWKRNSHLQARSKIIIFRRSRIPDGAAAKKIGLIIRGKKFDIHTESTFPAVNLGSSNNIRDQFWRHKLSPIIDLDGTDLILGRGADKIDIEDFSQSVLAVEQRTALLIGDAENVELGIQLKLQPVQRVHFGFHLDFGLTREKRFLGFITHVDLVVFHLEHLDKREEEPFLPLFGFR